jgi:DNA adenine methylase
MTYVEPFCGAASVFLRKAAAEFEVINDVDGEVVNFFRVLRGRPEELVRAIELTPYSREEYLLAWVPCYEEVERARRLYIRAWQGWGGTKNQRVPSWRFQHSNNRGKSVVEDWTDTRALWAIAERLRGAFIEHDEALNVIQRYDQGHTLFYLDPPYLAETRSGRWAKNGYRCEVDRDYHVKLLDMLQEVEGMVVISGYPSRLYEERLGGWHRFSMRTTTTNTSNTVAEVIWVSPRAMEARSGMLFGFGEGEVSCDGGAGSRVD